MCHCLSKFYYPCLILQIEDIANFFKNFVLVLWDKGCPELEYFLCEIDQSFLVESERHLIFYTHCCLLSRL